MDAGQLGLKKSAMINKRQVPVRRDLLKVFPWGQDTTAVICGDQGYVLSWQLNLVMCRHLPWGTGLGGIKRSCRTAEA